MTLEEAKALHATTFRLTLSYKGMQTQNEDDVELIKSTPLIKLLQASHAVAEHQNQQEKTKTFLLDDETIAATYLQCCDPSRFDASKLPDICNALDITNPDTRNGHAILIDAYSNFSIIELNHNGDGAERTLIHSDSLDEMLNKIEAFLEQSAEEDTMEDA